MKLEVKQKTEQKLFHRTHVVAEVSECESTPSRKQVQELLEKQLHAPAGAVVIHKIDQPFGTSTVGVDVFVYASAEDAKKNEPEYKFKRLEGKPAAAPK